MAYLVIDGAIETDRLLLRRPTAEDAGTLSAIFGDPQVMRTYGTGKTLSPDRVSEALGEIEEHYDRFGFGAQVVLLRNSGRLVGLSGLQRGGPSPDVQIGWVLAKETWRNGYAQECGIALLDYGFSTLGLERIEANAVSNNVAAIALIRKLGLTYENVIQFDGAEYVRFAALNAATKGRSIL